MATHQDVGTSAGIAIWVNQERVAWSSDRSEGVFPSHRESGLEWDFLVGASHDISRNLVNPIPVKGSVLYPVVVNKLPASITVKIDHCQGVGSRDLNSTKHDGIVVDNSFLDETTISLRNSHDCNFGVIGRPNDNLIWVLCKLVDGCVDIWTIGDFMLGPFLTIKSSCTWVLKPHQLSCVVLVR